MVVEAFRPSVHQFIETGIEEISVQVAEPLNGSFLDFGIGFEMATYQILLQRSEEMKITRCKIPPVGRVPMSLWWTFPTVLHTCIVTCSRTNDFNLFRTVEEAPGRPPFQNRCRSPGSRR
ncbi:hypothetical protein AVEN_42771-1 [Araneus ventricosus]|uniref:Uncharacterized protein n=1 Tax=Araneus ventricosus TaxID=182803 RepID=A0A4Y2AGV7_ARAVE|nr:hypothetical protein AVEN_42771-1 [Araneus ventricosus]